MKKLAKEEIIEGIVDPVFVGLNFAIAKLDNEDVDFVVEKIKEYAAKLKTEQAEAPTIIDVENAAVKLAETIAETTETEVDDKVVGALKTVVNLTQGKGNIFQVLSSLLKARKAVKQGE
jgi:hypothetical protein